MESIDKTFNVRLIESMNKENLLHTVKENETLQQIANLYNQTVEIITRVNNINNEIEAGDMLLIPRKNTAIYVVKPLDSLSKIANKFDVTEEHIKKANNIQKIFIGQMLII